MTFGFRVASVTMVVMLLLGGPLAPLASAQQPGHSEFSKLQFTDQPPADKPDVVFDDSFSEAAAGVMTAFLVPGRALTCLAGGAVGIALLMATLGTAYRAAGGVVNEGCGGKWIVRSEDIAPTFNKK